MEINFLKQSINHDKLLLCQKALDFAVISLAGKKRRSDEEIVDHCLRVAEILTQYKIFDQNCLVVAILHHTLKDSAATISDVRAEFGDEVAQMLEVFEKLHIVRLAPEMKNEFTENLRKLFLALARDLRIVLIKLADIMDNLTTLQYLDDAKRKEVAEETLEIFAPLVERLGMGEMKGEMQDLAFAHLYPKECQWIKRYSKSHLDKLEKVMPKVRAKLGQALALEGIEATLQSRIKHLYSLYKKLLRPGNNQDINKVYDLMAMRVIVESKEECYRALGVVNKLFMPLPEKVSDFIVHPKPNGYQSIHIKVLGPSNIPFEIQIRTSKMHEEAEYGIAAHWNYAEAKEKGAFGKSLEEGFVASGEKLKWVKRLSQWQEEITDNQEFLKTIKTDFFGERIFCFTPKGDVKDLPAKATPIDFAYTVHTGLGDLVTRARVNGKVVSLHSKLENGDTVELIISKDAHKKPSRDWLNFVVTSLARKKIKRALQVK